MSAPDERLIFSACRWSWSVFFSIGNLSERTYRHGNFVMRPCLVWISLLRDWDFIQNLYVCVCNETERNIYWHMADAGLPWKPTPDTWDAPVPCVLLSVLFGNNPVNNSLSKVLLYLWNRKHLVTYLGRYVSSFKEPSLVII